MGKFRVTESYRVTGVYEPVECEVAYYYCDKCGSFNIDWGYPRRFFDGALTLICVASFVGAVLVGIFAQNPTLCVGLILMGLVAWVAFNWGKHLGCRACGNENITSENVLNYPNEKIKNFIMANGRLSRRQSDQEGIDEDLHNYTADVSSLN